MAAAPNESESNKIRKAFEQRERAIEVRQCRTTTTTLKPYRSDTFIPVAQNEVDHKPLEMHLSMSVAYKYVSHCARTLYLQSFTHTISILSLISFLTK